MRWTPQNCLLSYSFKVSSSLMCLQNSFKVSLTLLCLQISSRYPHHYCICKFLHGILINVVSYITEVYRMLIPDAKYTFSKSLLCFKISKLNRWFQIQMGSQSSLRETSMWAPTFPTGSDERSLQMKLR